MTDDELDRAVARLTDAAPSPALRLKVMSRIAETPGASFPAWRLAFAAAAVLVIAASIWLALPPAGGLPGEQPVGRQPAHDVTLPSDRNIQPHTDLASGRSRPVRPGSRRLSEQSRHAGLNGAAGTIARPASAEDVIAIPPLAPPAPLPSADPVEVAPLTLDSLVIERLEIPPLEIAPFDRPGPAHDRH